MIYPTVGRSHDSSIVEKIARAAESSVEKKFALFREVLVVFIAEIVSDAMTL